MKNFIVFIMMLVCMAGTAYADDTVDLANIDQHLRLDIQDRAFEPRVIENHVYYEIHGDCEKDMRRQMTRNGTKWNDGKTYDSVTTWNINWDYDYNCTSEGCAADGFNGTVRVTFRYPKWIAADNAPQTVRDKWDAYMKNLVLHENGHRDIAVKATAALTKAVSEMSPAATPSELDRQVRKLSRKYMSKLAADQREYDAVTIHGATQGAVFP